MSKCIRISRQTWQNELFPKLREQYGNRILIRSVCQSELGFTHREYRCWDKKLNVYVDEIHLDIYDESARSHLMLIMDFEN